MSKFPEKIKEIRHENNLRQKDLAKILNCTDKKISFWETGYTEPNLDEVIRICLIFKVTADYLLGLEDDFGNKIAPGKYTIQDSFNNNSGKIDIR